MDIDLSSQPPSTALHFDELTVATTGGTGASRIGVRHDTGRESVLRPTPAKVTAWAHLPKAEGRGSEAWALVTLVFDVFGSEETCDLRVGVVSFSVEARPGQPVDVELASQLDPMALLVEGVRRHGLSVNPAMRPTRESSRPSEHEARDFLVPGGGTDQQKAKAQAFADNRERIANAWWDAKLNGAPIGRSVAKARGEDAPGSEAARNRADQYVFDLRRRGVLARVGQARGLDVAAYGVEPVAVS